MKQTQHTVGLNGLFGTQGSAVHSDLDLVCAVCQTPLLTLNSPCPRCTGSASQQSSGKGRMINPLSSSYMNDVDTIAQPAAGPVTQPFVEAATTAGISPIASPTAMDTPIASPPQKTKWAKSLSEDWLTLSLAFTGAVVLIFSIFSFIMADFSLPETGRSFLGLSAGLALFALRRLILKS